MKVIELNKKNINLDELFTDENDESKEKTIQPENMFDEMFNNKDNVNFPKIPSHDINNEPLTIEQTKERRKTMLHIQRYIKNFPDVCSEWKSIDLKLKTSEELNNILEEIKLTVGNCNANLMGIYAYEQSLEIIESIAPMLNMNLQGLSNIATRDKAIVDCVKECSLEFLSLEYVKPHIRLGILTGGLIMSLNNVNKKNNIIDNFLDNEISEDKIKSFENL